MGGLMMTTIRREYCGTTSTTQLCTPGTTEECRLGRLVRQWRRLLGV